MPISADAITSQQAGEVEAFLRRHPELDTVLATACEKLGSYFPAFQLRAEVVAEPDVLSEVLYCGIQSALSFEEAEECYEKFCLEWWYDKRVAVGNSLVLCTESL